MKAVGIGGRIFPEPLFNVDDADLGASDRSEGVLDGALEGHSSDSVLLVLVFPAALAALAAVCAE